MKKIKPLALIIILAFSLPYIYGGCGGGGGGGGDGGVDSLSYSGIESAADITSGNAQEIVASAYFGADAGVGTIVIPENQGIQDHNNLDVPILTVAQVLDNAIHQVNLRPYGTNTISAIIDDSDTIPGECGGSAFYTIRIDDVAGTFTGKMTFSDYCEDDIILSGRANFSGSFDILTGDILELSIFFNNLSETNAGETYRFDGEINIVESGGSILIDLELLIQNPSGEVFWVNNYFITLTEGPGYEDVEATGRFYHPNYGYVDFSTEVTLRTLDIDDWPSSGTLLFEGANNTSARLIAVDALTAQVTADTDGDTIVDFDTGPINWEDLY